MLKIWGRPNGLNVQKVMWCVGELNLDHERVDHGGAFGSNDLAWYRAMNPNGKVPTIDDEGFILWESNSIIRYLSEKHGRGDVWPEDIHTRAHASQWMGWQLGTLLKVVMLIFYNLIRKTPEERNQAELEDAITLSAEHFQVLDRHLEKMPHVEAWYARLCERPAYREHVMLPLT